MKALTGSETIPDAFEFFNINGLGSKVFPKDCCIVDIVTAHTSTITS